MKVKVLHPFGRFRTVGEVIDLPHRQARTLTAIGKTTMDVESQRPKRAYRRRDMVAEQATGSPNPPPSSTGHVPSPPPAPVPTIEAPKNTDDA